MTTSPLNFSKLEMVVPVFSESLELGRDVPSDWKPASLLPVCPGRARTVLQLSAIYNSPLAT
jgi:hypothetical protein